MLYIPKFAKEIGLDSISYLKLRVEKYSPLKEVVDNTPGYFYDRMGGPCIRISTGHKELKQIAGTVFAPEGERRHFP
jgi:hypothetical protein